MDLTPPGPRDWELSAYNLHDVAPVESDRELFMSAVCLPYCRPRETGRSTERGILSVF